MRRTQRPEDGRKSAGPRRDATQPELTDWGAFPNTVLKFGSDPPLAIDLRRPLADADRIALASIGLERSFGIVTAQDPMGVTQAQEVNSRLAARLLDDVRKLRVTQMHVDACGADSSHCEASVAIATELRSVVRLADRYRQLAIFWFDGDAFWIHPVRSGKCALKLPVCE
jgi:hypothetical protein